jgi:pimeloyl-ACP methyl ester carboxylesterase
MSRIRRHYVTVKGERQVHYRRAGAGPAFVLMHESPLSSQSLERLVEALADRFTVFALDTPGYGSSGPLVGFEQPEIEDYAAAAADTVEALGIESCAVYGAHTGAAIALELAASRPDLVTAAVLDGLPVFTSAERDELLERYLPTFATRQDGSHLLTLWSRYRDQHVYYPWYDRRLDVRMDIPMPSARHIQDGVMDLLRAGDGYRVAYSAAFRHVPAGALERAEVPIAMVAREDDLLSTHLERLPELKSTQQTKLLPRDKDAWSGWIGDFAASHARAAHAVEPAAWDLLDEGLSNTYVETSAGQLHVRGTSCGSGRPLVLFHASPTSARALLSLATKLSATRPVIAFDTLGNGESDKPHGYARPTSWDPRGPRGPFDAVDPEPPWDHPGIGDYADVIVEALDVLDVSEVDLYGSHTGGSIGVEAAIKLGPERARNLVVDGLALFTDEEVVDLVENYLPPLEPRWDGSHLVFAWAFGRAQTEFWPWYNQTREGIRWVDSLPAHELHTWVVELLKSGHTYPLAYRAAFEWPGRDRLPELASRTLIAAEAGDMLAPCSAEGAALAQNAVAGDFPDHLDGHLETIVGFLDSD